jgi:hypothetical protein
MFVDTSVTCVIHDYKKGVKNMKSTKHPMCWRNLIVANSAKGIVEIFEPILKERKIVREFEIKEGEVG